MLVKNLPSLNTPRLALGAFKPQHAEALQRLASERQVSGTMMRMPHPYTRNHADAWIENQADRIAAGHYGFAVTQRDSGAFVGAVALKTDPQQRAEISYWMGRTYWSQGYCTEAARAALYFGFHALDEWAVFAKCFASNPGSQQVLGKLGFVREGMLRQHTRKNGRLEDVVVFGLLKDEALDKLSSVSVL